MKVLVTGGRNYTDRARVWDTLDNLLTEYRLSGIERDGQFTLITGSARGADYLAECWAKDRQVWYRGYPAKWNDGGRQAGSQRNADMLRDCDPHVLVAFPGGVGTKNMKRLVELTNRLRSTPSVRPKKKELIRVVEVRGEK